MFKIDKNDRWWKLIIISTGILGLVMFLICSIPVGEYDLDYYISYAFGECAKNLFFKYFSYFYYQIGWDQIIFIIECHVLIMVESLFAYKILMKRKGWKKSYWTVWFVYGLFLLIWLSSKMPILNNCFSTTEYGSPVDFEVMLSGTQTIATQMIILLIEGTEFLIVTYVVHFIFAKNKNILTKKYWIISVQSINLIVAFYLINIFIKQSTGRPEGINNWFDEMIGEIKYNVTSKGKVVYDIIFAPEVYTLKNVDIDKFKTYIINILNSSDHYKWEPAPYYTWYQINGNWWNNLKFWQPFILVDGANMLDAPYGYDVSNFPSGHTFTSFAILTYGIYFKDNKSQKVKVWLRVLMIAWIINLLFMVFNLQIARVHWATDVFFTCFLQSLLFFPMFGWSKKICVKHLVRFNNKYKNNENELFINDTGKCYEFYVVLDDIKFVIKKSKKYNKKISNKKIKKITKKYKCFLR